MAEYRLNLRLGGIDTRLLQDKGWQSAGLGARILRLETAAIVGLGIIQYELGDL